ncbi:Shedu anti-phage system protein SduA domain-containing protein [Brevundimonas sp. MEB006b]|uniref:Shedu anti-phage system protein SduA domain-containing protein n=1 Tax=Brevundimonas sp. MEB006b TaxID=3040283 RepID=UPI00254A707F|nr:Shedu anti-phage system protein SduA domain-containing protein [Brevundimonas sp. MEB006b]
MALTPGEFAVFEALVKEPTVRRELECRPYLVHAEHLLIEKTLRSTVQHYEVRSYAGDADLILAADVLTDTGQSERVAFLWELKAPQCPLFEYDDNKHRCRPSADLIKAENQLLHYVDEAVANENTRARLGVAHRKDIRPGGIIIGTQKSMLRNLRYPRDVEMAATALRVRQERLYHAQGIRILLWDRVLDAVRPVPDI